MLRQHANGAVGAASPRVSPRDRPPLPPQPAGGWPVPTGEAGFGGILPAPPGGSQPVSARRTKPSPRHGAAGIATAASKSEGATPRGGAAAAESPRRSAEFGGGKGELDPSAQPPGFSEWRRTVREGGGSRGGAPAPAESDPAATPRGGAPRASPRAGGGEGHRTRVKAAPDAKAPPMLKTRASSWEKKKLMEVMGQEDED